MNDARGVNRQVDYTENLEVVMTAERVYLDKRRAKNDLPTTAEDKNLWGLALSGGGVRSATFGLGALQGLIAGGWLKRVDYLSTVSGGGYIGSCLSSLLSRRTDTGVDSINSPFVGLNEQENYGTSGDTHLSVRHQMHHLRTHGEYLVPRTRLFSRDVQRAIGSVISGIGHTISLFLLFFVVAVSLTHLLLGVVDPQLDTLSPGGDLRISTGEQSGTWDYVLAVLSAWYGQRLAPPLREIFMPPAGFGWLGWSSSVAGIVWSLVWFCYATVRARGLDNKDPLPNTRAGWTREEQDESNFVRLFNLSSSIFATVSVFAIGHHFAVRQPEGRFLFALSLPLWFAVGGVVVAHGTYVAETVFALRSWSAARKSFESRFRRSLYAAIRGACLYGVIAAIVAPALLVIVFSLATLPFKLFVSLAGLAWTYKEAHGGNQGPKLDKWVQRPLANVALSVFLAFGLAELSARLLEIYRSWNGDAVSTGAAIVGIAALLAFVALGVLIDANRVSPHYFYRDRLTEAYLKTDARVVRVSGSARQGMPLKTLRDDEDLKLSELGEDNQRGPYHLILTALNLRGSNELNRKSFLSDHFVFSRDYIGSRITGWTRTKVYRKDTTRLARAMTISAAAVGSAMGYQSFWAQAFVTTLFNARLGYWMENPWAYRTGKPGRLFGWFTFWPRYLLMEMFGWMSARTKLVNLSDGGHTGDNLGLLPLLQRRCHTIIVSDAEADGAFAFESFNNAVRMAEIEENIEIVIDLSPIMARKEAPSGVMQSNASVVVGCIRYPKTDEQPAFEGRLVYLKSSISGDDVPVHVVNYAKANPEFPHESTADQFFNDAQFEAYRALGNHVATMAVPQLGRHDGC